MAPISRAITRPQDAGVPLAPTGPRRPPRTAPGTGTPPARAPPGTRWALREDSARPSASRTVGQPTTRHRFVKCLDHPAGPGTAAARPSRRSRRVQGPQTSSRRRTDGQHARRNVRAERALEDLADRARIGRGTGRTPGGYISSTGGAHTTSTPSRSAEREVGGLVARVALEVLARPRTAAGSRTATSTTNGRSARARRRSDAWPSCSAPIVGTRRDVGRRGPGGVRRRAEASARRGSRPGRRAPPRRRRGPRASSRPGSVAELQREPAELDVAGHRVRRGGARAPRGCARPCRRRRGPPGPVSASAGPSRATLSRVARASGSIAADGIGDAGPPEQLLGDPRGGHDVVRREHGGGVVQRADARRRDGRAWPPTSRASRSPSDARPPRRRP